MTCGRGVCEVAGCVWQTSWTSPRRQALPRGRTASWRRAVGARRARACAVPRGRPVPRRRALMAPLVAGEGAGGRISGGGVWLSLPPAAAAAPQAAGPRPAAPPPPPEPRPRLLLPTEPGARAPRSPNVSRKPVVEPDGPGLAFRPCQPLAAGSDPLWARVRSGGETAHGGL